MKLTWNPPEIPKSITTTYQWGSDVVDYAVDVHFGTTSLGGHRGIDRPWTEVAIARNNIPKIFADNYRRSQEFKTAFNDLTEFLKKDFDDVLDNYDWGINSRNEKQVREGVPTWRFITDSGDLRDSLVVTTDVEP